MDVGWPLHRVYSINRFWCLLFVVGTIGNTAMTADGVELPRMIWSDRGMNTIRSANVDATDPQLIIANLGEARGVDVDFVHEWIYWADNGTNKIQRAHLDGTQIEDLVTTDLSFPAGVAVDPTGSKVYWADQGTNRIQRANLDGTSVETIVGTGLDDPYFLALDTKHDEIYWTDYSARKIQRSRLDGTNVETLVQINDTSSLLRGIDLDLVGGKMYWTDRGTDLIQRANLDGTQVETLYKIPASGVDNAPHGIAVDVARGHLYWVDNGTVKIQRSNLDGSNVVDLLTSASGLLSRPWEILLDFRPTQSALRCDLTNDGVCDVSDIDALTRAILDQRPEPIWDLTDDGRLDAEDRVVWVETIQKTYFGDSNLDGRFDTGDLVVVFQQGEYEDDVMGNSTWRDGDWDGDSDFTTRDLVYVFQRGGFEAGPRGGVAAVPEPCGWLMSFAALAMYPVWRRKGSRTLGHNRCGT